MIPSADAGRILLRIEPGDWPWTLNVSVYDGATGDVLERYVNRRVDAAPWFIRWFWKVADGIEAMRAKAAGRDPRDVLPGERRPVESHGHPGGSVAASRPKAGRKDSDNG